ncbi:DMT family transporter [Rhizobium sp. TRM96647]|uniref:DMT family transporter n=1 Tax=unclassified Rhizobium TaxID=2613769 RepID=UPI0021E97D29|nr:MULTISPECIES: DMT family transporter [unclassified Rhizobium]MCV3739185.1 DMT family transporter [Rhizobium sp. TRM96647]MCV3760810.1 DMT family transporter [Rhizobium sp. TRM96650]
MRSHAMPAIVAGALFMAGNSLVAAMDGVIVRLIAGEIHPLGIVFFRNLFSLVALYAIFPRGRLHGDPNMSFWVHAIRAVIKLLALFAGFMAVTQMPLASATAIAFTMPLFVMLGSVLFLGEAFFAARVAALVLGFAGVLIVLQPGFGTLDTGALWALAGAIGLAAVALLMKVSANREDPLRIAWLNLVITVPVALLIAIPVWKTPSLPVLGLMALQGVGGLLAQLAFARAMKLADASLLVVVDFIRLPAALFFGLVLFGEPIRMDVVVGATIILCAILMLFHRENGRRA